MPFRHVRPFPAPCVRHLSRHYIFLLAPILFLLAVSGIARTGASRQPADSRAGSVARFVLANNDVVPVTVSAASYETAAIAPDAIVAAFGTKLATGVFTAEDADQGAPGLQLPTSLGGTSVQVNGQLAGLFFVSPNQVNYVIPSNTVAGTATVKIIAGDGTVSTGTVEVAQVAPSLFTGNADGQGVPAAYLVRVSADNNVTYESVSQLNEATGRLTTRAIDLGPEGERVFLVLFGSGLQHASDLNNDNNFSETVSVVIGGSEVTPAYAGQQGTFVGLDQINVEIPRSLIGRGKISLSVAATGFSSSKVCEIEIAAPAGNAPPQISSFDSATVLAGQTLMIGGSGFSSQTNDNTVRISGTEATVTSASASQLSVQIPYGAESGMVSVITPTGEGTSTSALALRTSISGFVEDTNRQPMSGVTVKLVGSTAQVTTNTEGLFVLPDISAGAALVEVDAQNVTSPPFPKVTLKTSVTASRDNQFARPVSMQQATGPSISVGSGGNNEPQSVSVSTRPGRTSGRYALQDTITTDNVTFDLPAGSATFPDGATSGTIYMTLVDNQRTPVDLPAGQYSTAIVQLSPFGVTLSPGGKLTFPNPEGWAAGSEGTLFRFEQNPNSDNIGKFVEAGAASVSTDGQRVETADGAITRTGIYFVSRLRQMTTVTGQVFENDGKTPVRRALVRTRGQESFTDGNGGFIIRNVPVKAGESISVEASFQRPNGRIDRKQSAEVPVVIGGVTIITPAILLPAPLVNRPPVIQAPFTFTLDEGQNIDIRVTASDPDPGQTVSLGLTGPGFVTLIDSVEKLIRLNPGFNDAGIYTVTLTATDDQGARTSRDVEVTVRNTNRPPSSSGQSLTTDEDKALSITLTASDPDGDTITYVPVNSPLHGSISGTAPNLTFTPNANYNGPDSFSFKVYDGGLSSPVYTVNLTIRPVNDAPVANGQSLNVNEDTPINFALTGSDIDGNPLSFIVVTSPANGALSGTAPNLTYLPNANYNGPDSFTFKVNDGTADSPTATINFNVQPVNDAPTLNVPGDQTAETEDLISFTISGADVDAGQVLNYYAMNLPPGANFDPGTQQFTWTPQFHQVGTFLVDFKVEDDGTPRLNQVRQVKITATAPLNWAKTGPEGGEIFALFADTNGNIKAGTFEGIFKTTDGGANWSYANASLPPGGMINGFAQIDTNFFISRPGVGPSAGVFRFDGTNWAQINNGLTNTQITELIVRGPDLFVATDGGGVFRSSDNGANWTQINNGLQSLRVFSLTADTSYLYAGTESGISASTDNGVNWTTVNSGLPQFPQLYIGALLISGSKIYAGVDYSVYEMPVGGTAWTEIYGIYEPVNCLTASGNYIYAGTDGGGVYSLNLADQVPIWLSGFAGMRNRHVKALLTNGSNLMAATMGGIFISTDNGQNWTASSRGISLTRPISFAQSGSDLYAATRDDGIFRSTDNGATWTYIADNLFFNRATTLALDGTTLYAGLEDGSVYRTADNGGYWEFFGYVGNRTLPPGESTESVEAVANHIPGIFSLTFFNGDLYATTSNGVFVSPTDQFFWTEINNGLTSLEARSLIVAGTSLFVGTEGGGVFRSDNGGNIWVPLGTAANGLINADVRSLAYDGTNIYAGTATGVFVSPDNGATWSTSNIGLTNTDVRTVAINSGKLFVGTPGGVYISRDGGTRWKNASFNLANPNVRTLFISGATIFAGTDGSAAWKSSY